MVTDNAAPKKEENDNKNIIEKYIIKYEKDLFDYARSLTKNNKEKAEDLLQNTMYKALKNKDKYKKNTNIKGWLFTIMKNTFINDYRKQQRKVDTDDDEDHVMINNPSHHSSTNDVVNMKSVVKSMGTLKKELYEPLKLFSKGYTYKEIESQINVPIGTVKSRIHLARKKLGKLIDGNTP